jgi:hypothetical protein
MTVKAKESAAPFVPEERSLPVLTRAVQRCEGCDLFRHATQAVFGETDMRNGAADCGAMKRRLDGGHYFFTFDFSRRSTMTLR